MSEAGESLLLLLLALHATPGQTAATMAETTTVLFTVITVRIGIPGRLDLSHSWLTDGDQSQCIIHPRQINIKQFRKVYFILLRKLECLLYIWNIPASVLPGCQTRGDVGRGRDDEVVATAGRGNNTVLSAAHVITGLAGPQTTHPPAGIRWRPGSSSVGCIALQTSGSGD